NGPAQQRVIRQALANAGLTTADVDLVEAHGTGTVLGDPIEAQALINTYGKDRDPERPLWLGSLKSNIGHTQAAAGMAGVVKTILALRNRTMPRTLHVDAPTPHVDWSAGTVQLLTEARAWEDPGRPRRAGVSAFGVSGTNAHVILEEAPQDSPEETPEAPTPAVVPWVLSAKSPTALTDMARRLLDHVDTHPELTPVQIAGSLLNRARLDHRAVITGTNHTELLDGLNALANHTPHPTLITGDGQPDNGKLVFVYPGQGTQWAGMGTQLLDTSPVFAQAIAACEQALNPHVDWSLTDVIRQTPGAPTLDRVDVVQPTTFALMTALTHLYQHHGITPHAVIGHSQGEITAAHIAGALTLNDAARIITLRSQAIAHHLAGHGAMLSIPQPHHQLTHLPDGIHIATINGPHSTVVAGNPDTINQLHQHLTHNGTRARLIPVDYASHTPHVETIQNHLAQLLDGITPHTPTIPMYSTTNRAWVTEPLDAAYWYRNLRQTVHFHHGITTLTEQGHTTYLEISPHPVLTPAIQDTPHTTAHPTLRRNQHEPTTFHHALAHLHTTTNHTPNWHLPTTHTPLPTYPFQHHHYWPTPAPRQTAAADPHEALFWKAVEEEDLSVLSATLDVGEGREREAVASALPALAGWRRRSRQRAAVDSWRYRIAWRQLGIVNPGRMSGTWLVVVPEGFAGDGRVRDTLDALRSYGAKVVVREIGEADRSVLADRLAAPDVAGHAGVLSFLSLDERPSADFPAVPKGLALLAALVPALSDAGVTAPLWAVTTGGGDGPDGPEISPAQALTWGFGLVAALEQPRLWGGLVDLPAEPDEQALRHLVAVLRGQGGEDQLAIRAAGVSVRRLVRAPLGELAARRTWAPRGTVLVTGTAGDQ
ncbi:acyltransferase domain-containing protein, partial [Streptomyces hyaluromycini]